MTRPPALVLHAEQQHGVAAYARDVADAIERMLGAHLSIDRESLPAAAPMSTSAAAPMDTSTAAPMPQRLHLHFTDRLWGETPDRAAAAVEALAVNSELTVTLHDLPQPSDGERNLARRADAYRRVIAASAGVACNSNHEAALVAEFIDAGAPMTVIPLPVSPRAMPHVLPPADGDVAIIGFFYPGKGHAEVIDAVALLREADGQSEGIPGVVALGRASVGHEAELADLTRSAAERGIRFSSTGYLDDQTLLDRCRRASVPVAAHQHVSASGSLTTWIAAGRRALVPVSRYSEEMAALRPGTVTLYSPETLCDSIRRALDDPASTWLAPNTVVTPDLDGVAVQYLAWWKLLGW